MTKLISVTEDEHDKFHALERELKKNLEKVEDIEDNLNIIKGQMKSLKNIVARRKELHNKIMESAREGSSEDAVRNVGSYLKHFDKLGVRIDKLMKRLVDNVEAIHMDEAHELFHEPEDAQVLLRQVADEAENLHNEIAAVRQQLKQQTDGVQSLRDSLNNLVHAKV